MSNTVKVFIAAIIVAACLSPFASSFPDGLEKVAEDKGFLDKGEGKEIISSPIPDYALPGVHNEGLATSTAGVLGTVLTFGAAYGLGKLVRKKGN